MRPRSAFLLVAVTIAFMQTSCGGALAKSSDQSSRITAFTWWMIGVAAAVTLAVLVALGWALFRRRDDAAVTDREPKDPPARIFVGGAALTAVILAAVFAYSVVVTRAANPDNQGELLVSITGHSWSYDVRYPSLGVESKDVLHLPEGRQVRVEVESGDVIHSFWVPELNGKIDILPGRKNDITISNAKAGTYTARCAEFCGIGHTGMTMEVVVEPETNFAAWIAAQTPIAETK